MDKKAISVVGTVRLDAADPDLAEADAVVRALFAHSEAPSLAQRPV